MLRLEERCLTDVFFIAEECKAAILRTGTEFCAGIARFYDQFRIGQTLTDKHVVVVNILTVHAHALDAETGDFHISAAFMQFPCVARCGEVHAFPLRFENNAVGGEIVYVKCDHGKAVGVDSAQIFECQIGGFAEITLKIRPSSLMPRQDIVLFHSTNEFFGFHLKKMISDKTEVYTKTGTVGQTCAVQCCTVGREAVHAVGSHVVVTDISVKDAYTDTTVVSLFYPTCRAEFGCAGEFEIHHRDVFAVFTPENRRLKRVKFQRVGTDKECSRFAILINGTAHSKVFEADNGDEHLLGRLQNPPGIMGGLVSLIGDRGFQIVYTGFETDFVSILYPGFFKGTADTLGRIITGEGNIIANLNNFHKRFIPLFKNQRPNGGPEEFVYSSIYRNRTVVSRERVPL